MNNEGNNEFVTFNVRSKCNVLQSAYPTNECSWGADFGKYTDIINPGE